MTWTSQGPWPRDSSIPPGSLYPSHTGQTATLGCTALPLVQPFAHAVPSD